MMKSKKSSEAGVLVLRIFFGLAFVIAGLDKVFSFDMAKGMFEGMFGSMGAAMLVLAIVIELVGGLSLLSGYFVKYSAPALAAFIVVALVTTFKLGESMHFVGMLREMVVMNTSGANTAVNLAYLAGLVSLTVSEWVD